MNSFGTDKGTTIRYPSTANLMVYSWDSNPDGDTTSADFQITRAQAIQNGFFTRITSAEVLVNWFIPNVYNLFDVSGTPFSVDISGVGVRTAKIPNNFYNAAELIDTVVAQLNTLGVGTWSVVQNGALGKVAISSTVFWKPRGGAFFSTIWTKLGISQITAAGPPYKQAYAVGIPKLSAFAYIDFVSEQMTYNQDLKDFSTSDNPRDILARWWFQRTDDQTPMDKYGYPILYGYAPFKERRVFPMPKQIKWDPIQPLGNVRFEVYYAPDGSLPEGSPYPLVELITQLYPTIGSGVISGNRVSCFSFGITFLLSEN